MPLLYPAALYALWVRGHRDGPPARREFPFDVIVALVLAVAAGVTLIAAPAWLSWYFRLYRFDLLALALFATAAGVIVLGLPQVVRLAPAYALLFLAWPYPLIRVQQLVGPAFSTVTNWAGRATVGLLQLPFTVEAGATGVFRYAAPPGGHAFSIILVQACSGTATTLGFLAIGLGLWAFTHGPLRGKLLWLATGMALAFAGNLVRVAVLLTLAGDVSEHLAVDIIHPILGLVMFGLVFLAMLVIHPRYGLSMELRPHGEHVAWEGTDGDPRLLAFALPGTALVAIVAGVLVVGAQAYPFTGAGNGLPPVDVSGPQSVLPSLASWNLTHEDTIDWTDLFGRQSHGDLFLYEYQPTKTGIVVQTITTNSLSALNRYPVAQCVVFHGETIDALRYVALPDGMVGTLLHRHVHGIPSSVLAWEFPISVGGQVEHARIMLLLDVQEPPMPVNPQALGSVSTARQMGIDLRDRVSGTQWEAGPLAQVDLELRNLAAEIIRATAAGKLSPSQLSAQ